jgi:hypothetical protein
VLLRRVLDSSPARRHAQREDAFVLAA